MTRRAGGLVLVLLLGADAGLCAAQERRWEIEVYGGAVVSRAASEGRQTLPAPGPPIVTSSPLSPSREVPSWFFGDGTVLVNDVNEEFEGASRIAPLDALFARGGGGVTGSAGARIRRAMSARTSLEIAVDVLGRASIAPSDLASGVEAARRSFGETFTELLRTGPFTSIAVDAAATVDGAKRNETAATLAFNTDVGRLGGLIPYLTFGGGIVTGTGTQPSADLTGHYRFSILGQVPIDETDRVTVRFERPIAFAAVVGGGLRKAVSERWALRVDARALVGPDRTRVRVMADPSVTRGTPAGFIESFPTNPAIQFSNEPSLGRRSSLNDTALETVVFEGGIQSRIVVTVGIARRF